MSLDAINWAVITPGQAARLLGAAHSREQAAARAWDKADTPETWAAWREAMDVEEDLLVLARCGERPAHRINT